MCIFVELVTGLIMPHIVEHENFRDTTAYKEMRQQERTYTLRLVKWVPFKFWGFFWFCFVLFFVKMSHGRLPGIADVMIYFLKLHSHFRNVHNNTVSWFQLQ